MIETGSDGHSSRLEVIETANVVRIEVGRKVVVNVRDAPAEDV